MERKGKLILAERIDKLARLGDLLRSENHAENETYHRAYAANNWFTIENIQFAMDSICRLYLNKDKLNDFVKRYEPGCFSGEPKTIGVIAAGNLPLVCFHDILCCYVCGHQVRLKLSHKDAILPAFVLDKLSDIDAAHSIEPVEMLTHFDAVIATGSNQSLRHFEYYFKKKPHLLRGSKTSLAVIQPSDTTEVLVKIMADALRFFGLGCRNVSHVLIPEKFEISRLFDAANAFAHFAQHKKYMNNYDYNRTILLMNRQAHFANEFLILQESEALYSPLACLNYSCYNSDNDVHDFVITNRQSIQCVVSSIAYSDIETVLPDTAQTPELHDYADGADTIRFLSAI